MINKFERCERYAVFGGIDALEFPRRSPDGSFSLGVKLTDQTIIPIVGIIERDDALEFVAVRRF